jgi:hypothetical protein
MFNSDKMEEDKICRFCKKPVDISKDDFVVAKDQYEENFMHLNCYRKNEIKQLKGMLIETIDDM